MSHRGRFSSFIIHRLLICFSFLCLSNAILAETTTPESLRQWRDWIIAGHPDFHCQRLANAPDQKHCAWPGLLQLKVSQEGARFTQNWQLQAKSWVPLPGGSQQWPTNVTVNDRPGVVISRDRKPFLWLPTGQYAISGELSWQQRPHQLWLPPGTALLSLILDGKTIDNPQIDAKNRLLLARQTSIAPTKSDDVQVEVFRRLADGVPMQLHTVIRLGISGPARELQLGRLLPEDSEIMALRSPLPARIEIDGSLRLQARAGEWQIELDSRYLEAPKHFGFQRQGELWPQQEIWAFSASPEIRGVRLSGAPAIDPSQLRLPGGFEQLPVYLLQTDSTLQLETLYRGAGAADRNQLTLNRTIWLDFDGDGATARDHLQGQLQKWRLETQPELILGRAEVNGTPQLITRLSDSATPGIEIRYSNLDLEALSRIEHIEQLSASGWNEPVNDLQTQLELPPGWRLWHAAGPDYVGTSWLSRWTLWDIFLCLLIVAASAHLLGWKWAALATATLALTYHENNAPLVMWAILLTALPLLRALPSGKLKQFCAAIGGISALILILLVLAFAVQEVRLAIYPQLEQARAINAPAYFDKPERRQPQLQKETAMEADRLELSRLGSAAPTSPKPRYSPQENVQTGPGEPQWQWHSVNLSWSGPVQPGERLNLFLSPPWLTRLLHVLAALLVSGYAFGLLRGNWRAWRSLPVILAGLCLLPSAPSAQAGDFPSPELLKEYENRLLQVPDCEPGCTSINRAQLLLRGDQWLLRLEVATSTDLAIPLPGDNGWQPTVAELNGQPAALVRHGEQLLLPVSAGNHQVLLRSPLNGDRLQLTFPLNVHYLQVDAPDWEVAGLQQNELSGRALVLTRLDRSSSGERLLPDPIPAYVRVVRQLQLDTDWRVWTRVERLAPQQGPINVSIPLIPGEAPVRDDLNLKNGMARIQLGASQQTFEWRSRLPVSEQLTLTAPPARERSERWEVAAGSQWHVASEGPAALLSRGDRGFQTWQPWPEEQLTLRAFKPGASDGATTTVEQINVRHQPGDRSAELQLDLSIRSSLGGDYHIAIDEDARLKHLRIEGQDQPSASDGASVSIPLRPGLQQVELLWELPRGHSPLTKTPLITLDSPSTNIEVEQQLPPSRWVLWVGGPHMGPALLYWGVLVVILLLAAGLGAVCQRLGLSIPLRSWHWLLLGLGMSTVNAAGSLVVVAWFFAMEARRRFPASHPGRFNATQLGLAALTLLAAASLLYTIPQSLLAMPDMQVTGNGSSFNRFRWYQDYSNQTLPTAFSLSVPLWIYRLAMLAWSLWLVFALLSWIRWGWQSAGTSGFWRSTPDKPKQPATPQ